MVLLAAACGAPATSGARPESVAAVVPSVEPSPAASAPSSGTSSVPPAPLPSIEWATYTSERFAYSVEYPAEWIVTPATADWPTRGWPEPGGAQTDRIGHPGTGEPFVSITSVALAAGEVAGTRRSEIDAEMALVCRFGEVAEIEVDGAPARIRDARCFGSDDVIEVFIDGGSRIWLVVWFGKRPPNEVERAVFEAVLQRVRLEG